MQTIHLDTPPGPPRPGDLIAGVLEGTGLEVPEAPASTFFGDWAWVFDVPDAEWNERVVPIVEAHIVALYNQGVIRYGSWSTPGNEEVTE